MERLPVANSLYATFDGVLSPGADISLVGSVQNLRRLSWGGFILLRTAKTLVQVVVEGEDLLCVLNHLKPETVLRVTGTVRSAAIKDKAVCPQDAEVNASSIEVISLPEVDEFPVDITKKELNAGLNTLLDYRPLTLRHPKQRALFRVQAAIQTAFGDYLSSVGFTRISSPKIVFSGAEGGSNVFQLDYFGQTAYLAQSPQFYKQMMVGVFGRVFEEGPVFRAEKHNTSRHLNEYVSLDLEMRLESSFHEIMQVEAATLNSIVIALQNSCSHELELLGVGLPRPMSQLILIDFSEALELLYREYGVDQRREPDLSPEAEKLLSQYALEHWESDYLFVTGFPTNKRPFYTMADPADPEKTLSFDLLFRGTEITTGGQRLHRYRDYVSRMKSLGMDTYGFESYLQTFKFGMPPHGGLGLGLERFTARLCGLDNVKEASLFPRDMGRLVP